MTQPSEILKDYTNSLIHSLQNIDLAIFNEIISLEIDCRELAPFEKGCHGTDESDKIFSLLHNNGMNGRSAVYWFEIISPHTAEDIRSHYATFRNKIGLRTIPAIYPGYEPNSKVFYVGKGKTNISGRMYIHFGYEKRPNLQGLQLCHWDYQGCLKNLQLRLNIIYLPVTLNDLAPLFEFKLAKTFRLILGKHP